MKKALLLLLALVCASRAEDSSKTWKACFVLYANTPPGDDTRRIQEALNLCSPGMAVVLKKTSSSTSFGSAPLILPRGVTLLVDGGATLYASRNARDYDIAGQTCDPAVREKTPTCKPFIFSYQAPYSGIAGKGTIDCRGCPMLVADYESQGFHISGLTLKDASRAVAAIYKTIAVSIIDAVFSSQSTGILLSNVAGAKIMNTDIKVRGQAIDIEPSILGPTTGVDTEKAVATPKESLDLSTVLHFGDNPSLVVAQDRSGNFTTVQQAIDALPADGGEILVKPGTYREVVTLRKPHVHLHGEASLDPAKTVIMYNNAGPTHGGTFNSSTFFVEADDVTLDHFTVANDAGPHAGQAVALSVRSDRVVFRHMRFLGAQDTLYAQSKHCYSDYGPCVAARQYFADSYIEGGVDFIFGDAKAVFERCELHGISTGNVMFTAQSKHTADQDSGYVFKDCKLTGDKRSPGVIALGRAWRPYATVVFLNTEMDAPITPAGWVEWLRFGVSTLPTAFFAEYHSTGPGASPQTREPYSHQLTAEEAAKWASAAFLAGSDGWNPAQYF